MMEFDKFKKQFDGSFTKVKPKDFVKKMETLGYKFNHVKPDMASLPGGWVPSTEIILDETEITQTEYPISLNDNGVIMVLKEAFSTNDCNKLIDLMKSSNISYPVTVQGRKDIVDDRIGSNRATAWSIDLANKFWDKIKNNIPERRMTHFTSTDWWQDGKNRNWKPIGVSPLLRFMKYDNGGEHYAHYDAGYIYNNTRVRTLMSFVLYLTTNKDGGATRFIDDKQSRIPIWNRNHNDWTHETPKDDVMCSVYPVTGNMLLFDHRICHDVEKYTGSDPRIIIRGDIIFEAI